MSVYKILSLSCRLVLASLLLWAPFSAMANLMLFPTRLVIENNQRATQVQLVNRGTTPASYRINVVNRRMTETGDIVAADTPQPGELFASDMLRYSPRQVTLQPGESQTVRISLRKPAGLAPGEYRSHLQFDRLPDAEGSTDLTQAAQPAAGQLSIKISTLIGASIPVIVRHGETEASISLAQLAFGYSSATDDVKADGKADGNSTPPKPRPKPDAKPAVPQLIFQILRNGNRSVYGDITISYTPVGGQSVDVARVNGLAVYVPNSVRIVKIPLNLPEGMALKGGELAVRYDQRAEDGGKNMAQAKLALP
jgi:hypothetical protein